MKTYEFKLCFCDGYRCGGTLTYEANSEKEAENMLVEDVCDRLVNAFPSLDIEYEWSLSCIYNETNITPREKQLIHYICDIKSSIDGRELEMTHWDGNEDCVSGWYAYEYIKDGCSIPLEGIDDPIITDENIEKYNIDVCKVFNCCNVSYCG